MASGASIVRDVRALGSSAPLRALYEASKRTGFHGVLFRPRRRAHHRSQPVQFGCVPPQTSGAQKRTLDDAAAILDGGVRVFGTRAPTGVRGNWSLDPLTGTNWPETDPWWQIDIRSDERLSDVKFVWEAARHRDLVVLARAATVDPDGRWMEGLVGMLERWCSECPPERGVNWYSSLELALRAVSWNQVLALVGANLPERLRYDMDTQLRASARHIMIELPYTVSSMKNNHLLGDGLGLILLASMFPTVRAARRWRRLGNRMFDAQLGRHMRPDGSMIEDSLSYHRFVLEMLVVRFLLGDTTDSVREAMVGAARHLIRLGALDGPIPQFGDWDEGRVLADSAAAGSVAGSALVGLALGGDTLPADLWDEHDELAWYLPSPVSSPGALPGTRARAETAGDFQHVRHGEWSVWFKTSGGSSHQHADISSVWVRRGDSWVIADPGTGTYNGPLHVRNGFRTSSAHPVWHPQDVDQMGPHRAFRWMREVRGHAAVPLATSGQTVLFAWHDAFERGQSSRVARVVSVTEKGVLVRDFIENVAPSQPWYMTVPLAPGSDGADLCGLFDAKQHEGSVEPFRGWSSPTYGCWEPAPWLTVQSKQPKPPAWGCGPWSQHEHACDVEWGADDVTARLVINGTTHELKAARG